MKQSHPELGSNIYGTEGRDAIHIAILPVKTLENLSRADYLKIVDVTPFGVYCVKKAASKEEAHGIADPYLESAEKDSYLYMCMFPYTITSLRHTWQHPNVNTANFPLNEDE